jgi:hypothetical protein
LTAPQFRLAWVMVGVAIAALDFAAIRAMYGFLTGELLMLGALPMANVLVVGKLASKRRSGSLPFLLGFEIFGAAALAIYVTWAILTDESTFAGSSYGIALNYCGTLLFDPVVRTFGRDRPVVASAIRLFLLVVLLCLPQLTFAIIGGFLSRRFKVTRRECADGRDEPGGRHQDRADDHVLRTGGD